MVLIHFRGFKKDIGEADDVFLALHWLKVGKQP